MIPNPRMLTPRISITPSVFSNFSVKGRKDIRDLKTPEVSQSARDAVKLYETKPKSSQNFIRSNSIMVSEDVNISVGDLIFILKSYHSYEKMREFRV